MVTNHTDLDILTTNKAPNAQHAPVEACAQVSRWTSFKLCRVNQPVATLFRTTTALTFSLDETLEIFLHCTTYNFFNKVTFDCRKEMMHSNLRINHAV